MADRKGSKAWEWRKVEESRMDGKEGFGARERQRLAAGVEAPTPGENRDANLYD